MPPVIAGLLDTKKRRQIPVKDGDGDRWETETDERAETPNEDLIKLAATEVWPEDLLKVQQRQKIGWRALGIVQRVQALRALAKGSSYTRAAEKAAEHGPARASARDMQRMLQYLRARAKRGAATAEVRRSRQWTNGMSTNSETDRRDGGRSYPVEIGPTTRRHHITGMAALNIPGRRLNGGDWHSHGCWFAAKPERLKGSSFTAEDTYKELLDNLGNAGIRDARQGLKDLEHPGGLEPKPVWAAGHTRAVIEDAWEYLERMTEYNIDTEVPPFDRWELSRLLPYPDQRIRLLWWGWFIAQNLEGKRREKWNEWRKEWRFRA